MTEYKPAQEIQYVRNPYYWKVDLAGHRLPYIDRIVLTIVPDSNAQRLQFQQGATDSYGLRPREYAEFKRGARGGNYTVYDGGPTFGTEFLTFNENPHAGLPPYELAWFQNQKFRQAVSYAIDRQAIINEVYLGHAIPEYGPESPADKFFYDPTVMQYPYSPSHAAEVLAEAGFKKGSDGVLRDAAGHPVKFVISTNSDNPDRVAIGNIVRQDLAVLGMQPTLAPESFNTLVNRLVESFRWETLVLGPDRRHRAAQRPERLEVIRQPAYVVSEGARPGDHWEAQVRPVLQPRRDDRGPEPAPGLLRPVAGDRRGAGTGVYTAIPYAYVAVRNQFGNISSRRSAARSGTSRSSLSRP